MCNFWLDSRPFASRFNQPQMANSIFKPQLGICSWECKNTGFDPHLVEFVYVKSVDRKSQVYLLKNCVGRHTQLKPVLSQGQLQSQTLAKKIRILVQTLKSFRVIHCDPLCQVLRRWGFCITCIRPYQLPSPETSLSAETLRGSSGEVKALLYGWWDSSMQHSCSEWVSPTESSLLEH